jgi:hypothetical protein
MTTWVNNLTPLGRTALLVLSAAVLAAIGFGAFRLARASNTMTGTETRTTQRAIPPIDANQPSDIETATFALG